MNVIQKVIILSIYIPLGSTQLAVPVLEDNKADTQPFTQEQIRDTFLNALSDDFLEVLAKDLVARVAERFIKEMKKKRQEFGEQYNYSFFRSPDKFEINILQAPPDQLPTIEPPNEDISATSESNETESSLESNKAESELNSQTDTALESTTTEPDLLLGDSESALKSKKVESVVESHEAESALKSSEAFYLIRKPSPDGDNLDPLDEDRSTSSSGEEKSIEATKRDNVIPVIQLTKINGKYYRRLLGLI